jgi:hypothetical protein
MAPRLPQEVRDLIALTRQGIGAVDAVLRRFWGNVVRILQPFEGRMLTRPDRMAIMRQVDRVIDRVYGATKQAALVAELFTTIAGIADVAIDGPFVRMIERTRTLVERRQPGFWQRIRARAAIEPSDPFLRVVAAFEYRDAFGNRIIPESVREGRRVRSRLVDSNRRWVDGDNYRLSDRVWRQGRDVRRAIDARIVQGIRNGEDALSIARDLERYLNPSMQPDTIRANGKVVRRNQTRYPGRGGWGSYAARRLVQTELNHAFNQATIEAGKVTPGATGARWVLSTAHVKQDNCDNHARGNSPGMGRGEYTFRDFPRMPDHPLCRCHSQIVTVSRDEMVDMLISKYGDAR